MILSPSERTWGPGCVGQAEARGARPRTGGARGWGANVAERRSPTNGPAPVRGAGSARCRLSVEGRFEHVDGSAAVTPEAETSAGRPLVFFSLPITPVFQQ